MKFFRFLHSFLYMHILSLTRVNSLPLKSRKKENYKENGKMSMNKIYFIYNFTHDVKFLLDLGNK